MLVTRYRVCPSCLLKPGPGHDKVFRAERLSERTADEVIAGYGLKWYLRSREFHAGDEWWQWPGVRKPSIYYALS